MEKILTPKQKGILKALANPLSANFQIGKDGISDNLIQDLLNYLEKHELMKVSLLQTCPNTKEEIGTIFSRNSISVVQVIGRTFILYKKSEKNPKINLKP